MARYSYNSDADRHKAQLERAIGRVRAAGASLDSAVIDAAERLLRGRENVPTALANATALATFFAWCAAEGVDPFSARYSDAKRFLASLSAIAPGTRKSYLNSVKAFYRVAAIEEMTSAEPFRYVESRNPKAVTPTPALTKDELQSVLRPLASRIGHGSASLLDRRDFAIIFTTARTAGRSISMRTVTWAGWRPHAPGGVITFVQKGGGAHVMTVPKDIAVVLEAWRTSLQDAIGRPVRGDEPIFPAIGRRTRSLAGARGRLRPLRVHGMNGAVQGRYRDVGIAAPRLGFHALRATSATLAHEGGATNEQIQATGGWSSLQMVDLYIKRKRTQSALDCWGIDLSDPAAGA